MQISVLAMASLVSYNLPLLPKHFESFYTLQIQINEAKHASVKEYLDTPVILPKHSTNDHNAGKLCKLYISRSNHIHQWIGQYLDVSDFSWMQPTTLKKDSYATHAKDIQQTSHKFPEPEALWMKIKLHKYFDCKSCDKMEFSLILSLRSPGREEPLRGQTE